MNKFDILENVIRLRLREESNGVFIEDGIKFAYDRHSTGRSLNCYLLDGDETLHVYYDYDWFSERYEFNEIGKKHGYLIDDAPWNDVIEKKFEQFECEIVAKQEELKKIDDDAKERRMKEELDKIEKFKRKFVLE